jgi:hypothetical protein
VRAPGAEARAAGAMDWIRRAAIKSCATAARADEVAPMRDDFFADLCFMGEDSFTVPSFSPKLLAVFVVVWTSAHGLNGVSAAGGP